MQPYALTKVNLFTTHSFPTNNSQDGTLLIAFATTSKQIRTVRALIEEEGKDGEPAAKKARLEDGAEVEERDLADGDRGVEEPDADETEEEGGEEDEVEDGEEENELEERGERDEPEEGDGQKDEALDNGEDSD